METIDTQLMAAILTIVILSIVVIAAHTEKGNMQIRMSRLKDLLPIPEEWQCSLEHFDCSKLNEQQKKTLTELSKQIPKPLKRLAVETIEQYAAESLFGSRTVTGFRYQTEQIGGYDNFGDWAELTISIFGTGAIVIALHAKVLNEADTKLVEMVTVQSFHDVIKKAVAMNDTYHLGLIAERNA